MTTNLPESFPFLCRAFLFASLLSGVIPAAAQTRFLVVTAAADDAGTAANCTPQLGAGSGSDAKCSLRDALANAALSTAPANNISFDATGFSSGNSSAANTIKLTAGPLNLPANTTVNGPTAGTGLAQSNLVTISGNQSSTVFAVATGIVGVHLSSLNITAGASTQGGGIVNDGTLVVTNCNITGNTAASTTSGLTTGGGGILNSGKLTVNGSTIAANSATALATPAQGGGIENSGTLTLVNSTVSGNTASAGGTATGGGIFTTNAPGSSLTLSGVTVSANSADGAGGGVFSSRTAAAAMSQPQNRTLQALGDSITYGYASSGCPAPYTPTTTLADSHCWAGLAAYNLGYSLYDTGVSDSGAGDVSAIQIYNSPTVHGSHYGVFTQGAQSISTFLIGVVDDGEVAGETVNYFNGTRDVTEWQMEHEDVTAFMLTPNKLLANSSACTPSSGWFASTLWATGGLETTTNAATFTCPIVGDTAYISVMAQVGNSSSISVSIDHGPATLYTYALSSASRGLGNTTTGELFRIPNLLPTTLGTPASTAHHSITITANVNAAGPVFLNWVDGNGNEAKNGAGPVVFALSPYQTDIRTDADGALPRFRSFLAQEAADLRSDGLNEIVGDLSIPCTAIPVSNPPVSLCDTFDGTHPLDSGHALIAAYVEQLILNYISFGSSIVAGNTAPLGPDTNDLYVDAGGNQVGVSSIGLASLSSFGGPTQTMIPLPGSPALCAGSSADLNGATTDQRGLPRMVTYGTSRCVDAGAVQTAYALAFSTEPPTMTNVEIPIAPAPVTALTESGMLATESTAPVSLTDGKGLLSGTETARLADGKAAFNNLAIASVASGDTLIADLALTPSLSLRMQSSAFQAIPTVLASLNAPVPGTMLAGSSITFNWTQVSGATGYYLEIGSTGAGSNNIYNSAEKTVTTYTFTGMPANGETIYVRLTTNFHGTWKSNDYTYTAAAPATMITPAPKSVLPGSSVTFTWTPKAAAGGYYLWIGSTGVGSNNIYNSEEKTVTTYTFTPMPTNGESIYVRLITNYSGTWVSSDSIYTAFKQPAQMIAPAPNSTLPSSASVTFSWSAPAGATGYYLWIGSNGVGSNNIYNSEEKTVTTYTFAYMPTNGETIYVRLITNYNGAWIWTDYTYAAANSSAVSSPSPSPGPSPAPSFTLSCTPVRPAAGAATGNASTVSLGSAVGFNRIQLEGFERDEPLRNRGVNSGQSSLSSSYLSEISYISVKRKKPDKA